MQTTPNIKMRLHDVIQNFGPYAKRSVFLVFLSICIVLTLVLINKEYGEIKDSEAAKNKTVVFTEVNEGILNTTDNNKLDKILAKGGILEYRLVAANDQKITDAQKIQMPLFNEGIVTFDKKSIKNHEGFNAKSWKSFRKFDGIKYSTNFTIFKNSIVGSINSPTDTYSLIQVNNFFVLTRCDVELTGTGPDVMLSSENENSITNDISDLSSDENTNYSRAYIKIRALYSPAAADEFGGEDGVKAALLNQVENTQDYFKNSGIIHHLEIVQFTKLPAAVDSWSEPLSFIISFLIQFLHFDLSYSLNNAPDIALIYSSYNSDGCGFSVPYNAVSNTMTHLPFAYVNTDCITDNSTTSHEIAHLFGADHDDANVQRSLSKPYARGKGGITNSNESIMSIMSYRDNPECGDNPCTKRWLEFTRPGATVDGASMGDAMHDNVRRINEKGPAVAGYAEHFGGGENQCENYGNITCGLTCNTACDCAGEGYLCVDVSGDTPGKECWIESMCIIAPPRNRRISGKVLDCNGNPKENVKVASKGYSFNKVRTTNSQGIFEIWDTNNECSVELDEGQTFAVMAGKDADSAQVDYYGRVASPVFSKPEINCGNINCNYTGNQATGGPARNNYHLSVGNCSNSNPNDDSFFCQNPNVYNTYVCEEDGNFLSGFDFKQVNCPTPTPTPLTCNSVCTSNEQCSSANSNWYCARQFNYGTWSDVSSNVDDIEYTIEGGDTVYTDWGPVTGFNTHVYGTRVEQHLVKGGKIFYREFNGTVWDEYWQDKTSNIPSTLPGGTIIDFNSYRKPNGKIEQHLIKTSGPNNIVYSRNNESGWNEASWVAVTSNLTGNGTGPITGFTAYQDQDGYMIYTMVRNGEFWEGSNINGGDPNWKNFTSEINGCAGTSPGKCGSATLLSVERSKNLAGKDELYLIRGGGKVYHRESTPTDERCRLKKSPYSLSCSN